MQTERELQNKAETFRKQRTMQWNSRSWNKHMTFSKGYIYIIQIFRVRGENRPGFVLKKKKILEMGKLWTG